MKKTNGRKMRMSPTNYPRREFLRDVGLAVASAALPGCTPNFNFGAKRHERPNILFAIADDWSWPHANGVDDKVVKTPNFDRVVHEGVLFRNAFVTAPSCSPSRASILTGQYHWRLEEGGNLWGTLPAKFEVYPDLLEKAGYHIGYSRKGWGPGHIQPGGWFRNPAGPKYSNFREFLKKRSKDRPFCFWFGSQDPHRPYKLGAGVERGMRPEDVKVPPCLPDSKEIRTDLCDYYHEIERFDWEVGDMLSILESMGELDSTLVVITSDNGMPFPRCKSNLYDCGTKVPLAVRWGREAAGGRVVDDFISLADLAPTFLEAAGLRPTAEMTAKSFLTILKSDKAGQVDPKRNKVFTGKERHAWCRKDCKGYPMRAIRTREFLYIRNFKPDRRPAGDAEIVYPNGSKQIYADVDDSPTKSYMLEHRSEPAVSRLFELAFGKRPPEELYDLCKDPWQLNNVAYEPAYAETKNLLAEALTAELRATTDPRVVAEGDAFDEYPHYYHGIWRKKKIGKTD